ncbi:MAG: ribbon-helix-helix protein, CopG family [Microbacterium sp.]|uniref:CopG family ribbon-helix-helix protein n=1 Tax=Microbacterium sp. TaxID=51671 RepID=UPI0039E25C9E
MAMTLRLGDATDARLERLAALKRSSKSALVVQAVEQLLDREERRAELDAGLEFVLSHDAELLRRLEDA